MTSVAFRNVEVFDGLGGESFIADVGVKAGRIDCIGEVSGAEVEIEGQGYVLTPGFIAVSYTHLTLPTKRIV